jgi:hypothetical protein
MPGIGNNESLSEEEIAELLNFIRESWSNKADDISNNSRPQNPGIKSMKKLLLLKN